MDFTFLNIGFLHLIQTSLTQVLPADYLGYLQSTLLSKTSKFLFSEFNSFFFNINKC